MHRICIIYVVGDTDLSGKELHIQVGVGLVGIVGIVVTSKKPMWCTLARNARDVGSILALGTIFPIFITPTILVPSPGFSMHCMTVVPTLCICM